MNEAPTPPYKQAMDYVVDVAAHDTTTKLTFTQMLLALGATSATLGLLATGILFWNKA